MKLSLLPINETRVKAVLEWDDLQHLFTSAIRERLLAEGVEAKDFFDIQFEIKQETEGSPSYSVRRWRADISFALLNGPVGAP